MHIVFDLFISLMALVLACGVAWQLIRRAKELSLFTLVWLQMVALLTPVVLLILADYLGSNIIYACGWISAVVCVIAVVKSVHPRAPRSN